MEKKVVYISRSIVFGQLWAGYNGTIRGIQLNSEISLEDLIEKNKSALNDGTLHSADFEFLIGALLEIETLSTIVIEGKTFTNSEYHTEFIGNLTDENKIGLEQVYFDDF